MPTQLTPMRPALTTAGTGPDPDAQVLPTVIPSGQAVSKESGSYRTKDADVTTADAEMRKAREAALNDLDRDWGQAYDLAVTAAGWVAMRLDTGRFLVATSPGVLRALIVADYAAVPVPRASARRVS